MRREVARTSKPLNSSPSVEHGEFTPTILTYRSSPRNRPRLSGVSLSVDAGGIGFGLKWDMGWMHDTLLYISRGSGTSPAPPRGTHVSECLRVLSENFMLPAIRN